MVNSVVMRILCGFSMEELVFASCFVWFIFYCAVVTFSVQM
jgi:hypothetical protein